LLALVAAGTGLLGTALAWLVAGHEFPGRPVFAWALLLPLAGLFQVFDGLQVVALGLLRGLGDTRMPLLVNVVGFWCIGIPVSLWLGFGQGYGAVGLWWGLVVGLFVVAAFLIARLYRREHRDLERVLIDEHAKSTGAPAVVD
jgi:MATE family multidrug resistance protein